jgi:hypothetical protein
MSNRYAVAGALFAAALQALAVYWGPLAAVLGTSAASARDWAIVLGLGAVPAVVGQLLKGAATKRA